MRHEISEALTIIYNNTLLTSRIPMDWKTANISAIFKKESGNSVDVMYLDFMKAFDTVHHNRLLTKLKMYGITGQTYRWLETFLLGREQGVIVNGEESEWQEWLLKLHPRKCKIVHLSEQQADNNYGHRYSIFNTSEGIIQAELKYTQEEQDLGVLVNSKLNYGKTHIWNVPKQSGALGGKNILEP
ncbi:uncharacterized protein LOC143030326 [Oratosquilla oratoria]|uniref:uncharacterized protein LOC143030326 n=1 Tax=Oratosquilla oratoria TaxID=337810 RepID=UPI003F76562A